MAKQSDSVQPNESELQSRDFAADITKRVTAAVAESLVATLTESGLIAAAVDAAIAQRREEVRRAAL